MAGPLMNSQFVIPPSFNGLRALLAGGDAPPMPPELPTEMPIDEVAAAFAARPQRGRKPEYRRGSGDPTIDPLTGEGTPDLPPTFGDSYRNQIKNLLANTDTVGGANGVTSNISFKRPGDPRGANATIEFTKQGESPTSGSIFDNERGRQYATAVQARQEALDRGENPNSLPPLPGLRGNGLGTPNGTVLSNGRIAGVPLPGGKTDQYNQMKAAQRANQLANEANAPNLIMAREQMRNMGPRGAIMARMLAGGQGSMNDPTMLAAAGMGDAADAALKTQDINARRELAQSRDAMGLMGDYLAGGGDPAGLPDIQRNIAGGQGATATRPGVGIPRAPGVNPQTHDAAHSGVLTPELREEIGAAFSSTDLSPWLPEKVGPWSAGKVKQAAGAATEQMLRKYGVSREQAAELVKEWYRRKYESSYGLMPSEIDGPAASQAAESPSSLSPYGKF